MDIFANHLFDWILVTTLIAGAFYVLKVIGEEKVSFREDCYSVEFGNLSLMIPNWWAITEQSGHLIKFERTDTQYDWYASFHYFADSQEKTIPTLLEEKLNQEEIEFDKEVAFETDSRVLFRDPEVQEHFQEITRVEGTASKNVEDRIYYDIYIMRGLNDRGYFIFESMSSVLNGLVEGPYFEESLSELSFIHKTPPGQT